MHDKERRGMYAKIAIAKKQLGLDEDTYRDMLESEFGKNSAKDLNLHELARLLQKFVSLGVVFAHKGNNKKVTAQARPDWIEITDSMFFAKQKREILAIWRKLGYSMTSLETRVKREFNCHLFVWLGKEADIKKLLCDLQSRENAFDKKQKLAKESMAQALESEQKHNHQVSPKRKEAECGANA